MKPSRQQIESIIASQVAAIIRDWDLSAEVLPDTRLVGELGFSSMDVIDLFATLDLALGRRLPYEQFVTSGDGEYRQEITVAELAAFIDENFDAEVPAPQAV